MFNVLTARETAHLQTLGVKPAELLDPQAYARLPGEVLRSARHMIAGGLTWVFAAMLGCAVVLWAVTRLLPKARCDHEISAAEAL